MEFTCPTCNQTFAHDLKVIISHTEQHIIDLIKRDHPDWVEENGICRKCYNYLKSQLPGHGINKDSANG